VPITISLQGIGRKLLFAILLLAPCWLFLRVSSKPFMADRSASRLTRESLQRAAELEPANAERYFALARYQQLSGDFAGALQNLHTATELNPHHSRYWLELARSARSQNDPNAEGAALHEALLHDSNNALIAEDAGYFFLARGERSDAIRELRVAMEHKPAIASSAYDRLWQNTHDPEFMIQQGLPPAPAFHNVLLGLFLAQKQTQPAADVWHRWMQLPDDNQAAASFSYLDYLLSRGDYDAALAASRAFAARSSEIRARQSPGNLVLNGDFEDLILNGGLEWRYRRSPQTALDIDTTHFHSGAAALRIDYNGDSGVDAGIAQFVLLPAGTSFTFSGFMRAQEISSTHGPRLSVTDVATGTPLYTSEESLGTTPWTERTGTIPSADKTRLVAIQVTRETAGHITGHAWIDDMKLSPEARR